MDESTNKSIMSSGTLVITLIVLSVFFVLLGVARSVMNKGMNKVADLGTTIDESTFTSYDGQTITGTQAIALLDQFSKEEIQVVVVTKQKTTTYNYTSADLTTRVKNNNDLINKARKKSEASYINPAGKFTCTITRNDNGAIVTFTMTQE